MDLRCTLVGSFVKCRLTPESVFRHVLRQGRVSEEFGETETSSFSLLDIRAFYQVSGKTRFTFGINNIFDEWQNSEMIYNLLTIKYI